MSDYKRKFARRHIKHTGRLTSRRKLNTGDYTPATYGGLASTRSTTTRGNLGVHVIYPFESTTTNADIANIAQYVGQDNNSEVC